jgi:hypothetical protein
MIPTSRSSSSSAAGKENLISLIHIDQSVEFNFIKDIDGHCVTSKRQMRPLRPVAGRFGSEKGYTYRTLSFEAILKLALDFFIMSPNVID